MKINGESVIGIEIPDEDDYFHPPGCDNCGNGLACDVKDVNVYSIRTQWNDHYTVQLCHSCINSYYNAEAVEDDCKNLLDI